MVILTYGIWPVEIDLEKGTTLYFITWLVQQTIIQRLASNPLHGYIINYYNNNCYKQITNSKNQKKNVHLGHY